MSICVSCMSTFAAWDGERCCPACVPRFRPRKAIKPAVPFDATDGGRKADGFQSETNDCTVRALAVATGSRYADAHRWLQRRGRRMRKGCHFASIVGAFGSNVLGHRLEFTPLVVAKGLRAAIERNPQIAVGTWIIHSTHHVAVLRDGKLLDSFDSSRKVIDRAWRVLPLSPFEESETYT